MQPIPDKYGDLLFVSPTSSWLFTQPETCIVCEQAETLLPCLDAVDEAVKRGKYVAGFIAYEAGWVLMERSVPRVTPGLPLLWFGVYADRKSMTPMTTTPTTTCAPEWRPGITYKTYREQMGRIREYIRAGDTYQVNFTFPFDADFQEAPFPWFQQLYAAQPIAHAAYLDLGRLKILSLSPELFFQVSGDTLITRPMKGTMPRGFYADDDKDARERLDKSEKDRAENLMIVDLLRNDMGRISQTGSVHVEGLFDIERYATVWQMTSTISSRSRASFSETIKALFPCGSVTGAPKIRAMEIIDELESCPRGVYCGSVGWWGPRREAVFNVAIRTITLDARSRVARYPVGGGITWDSRTEGEYAECFAKATILTRPRPEFELLESLLLEDGACFLLEEHLDRLRSSADYFDVPLDRVRLRQDLLDATDAHPSGPWKVRLLVARNGRWRIAIEKTPGVPVTHVAVSPEPISSDNVFLYHKTTNRVLYEAARAACLRAHDVLLWNERGELTESTLANIVADMGDALITPPISCGLLGGVMRAHLLRTGEIHEAVIPVSALPDVRKLYLINSVRKWMPVQIVTAKEQTPAPCDSEKLDRRDDTVLP